MKSPRTFESKRRDFLKGSLFAAATLPALGVLLNACNDGGSTPPNGEQAAKADDPVAASLGYTDDATKVDTAKYPKRAGDAGSKQFCSSCQFFTAKGDSGWGACQIIRTGDVKATGWCNTWTAKS